MEITITRALVLASTNLQTKFEVSKLSPSQRHDWGPSKFKMGDVTMSSHFRGCLTFTG